MRIISKSGEEIQSVDDWFAKAPPKQGARHWKDYRSAKELAKAWFRTPNATPPEEMMLFLHGAFPPGELILTEAYPECIVTLDRFGGEQRNTDLIVLGTAGRHRLSISIEAKADEPFGDLVGDYYDRRRTVPGSNLPARIDALSLALFNVDLDLRTRSLRYQLLHATAAALIEAKRRRADVGVFVVHEFISNQLNPAKLECNTKDWRSFLGALTRDGKQHHVGQAIGPIALRGGEYIPSDIPLYLGKIQTQLP